MFKKSGLVSKKSSSSRLVSTLTILKIGLVVLLAQGPAYATDPIDADPNPDLTHTVPTKTIVVDSLEQVNLKNLPPGNYRIVVIDENRTFEIQVQ